MKKFLLTAAFLVAFASSAFAGGILTNTNQSVTFLRMLARDGAIGIDGVYSNPAGVAFLDPGFHISLNWQSAWQTRTITTTNPLFALGVNNNGASTKTFEGKARAPFIPSIQAAYNTDKWSFQFGFAVSGGGGKCEFDDGLGSFEGAVAQIAGALNQFPNPLKVTGYDMTSMLQGDQFYFGFTLGAAYKVTDNLSVYGGLRAFYGTASYKARIENIRVNAANGLEPFGDYLDGVNYTYARMKQAYDNNLLPKEQIPVYQALAAAMPQIEKLEVYRNGVNLQSDQTGFGIAPIIGIDYKTGKFNFAAKYEFRTHMGMKNKSTLTEAIAVEAANQFLDGTTVREDSPALLTLGAEYSILPNLRVDAGYHYFYDKQSAKYGNKQDLLKGGTNEYLGGIEYDATDKLTVSGGFQITKYGLSDEYMNDISFVVNSWTFGLGAKYKFNDKIALNVAYFQTNYGDYNTAAVQGVQNSFTRTNYVVGAGVDFTF
ncbi:MAG: outer membrane beta-barrel protein [Bacteroidaceae bacterium]|nr:outer membrane beta-barrel protein [Bacteroidaceae bacterium]